MARSLIDLTAPLKSRSLRPTRERWSPSTRMSSTSSRRDCALPRSLRRTRSTKRGSPPIMQTPRSPSETHMSPSSMTSAGTVSPKRASATLASSHEYSSASSTSPPPKRAARRWACRFAPRSV
eukprot:9146464-Pyramimonas_sp.AAC.1